MKAEVLNMNKPELNSATCRQAYSIFKTLFRNKVNRNRKKSIEINPLYLSVLQHLSFVLLRLFFTSFMSLCYFSYSLST